MTIQRHGIDLYGIYPSENGQYVTYTDHVAEVERVRLIEGMACEDHSRDRAEAMRAACISAVEADLTARIERDLSEGDSDGLVGGMAYALEKAIAALREVQP